MIWIVICSFVFFICKAIAYGNVLKNRKKIRNSIFYVLSRVLRPESNRIGLALRRVLAILWWEVSRPVLYFSKGIVRFFLRCRHLGKKSGREFQLYIDVSSENRAYFRINRVRIWFWVNWSVSTIFLNDILKKWQAAFDVSPEIAGGTSRKAGPIRPFPGSNTSSKVLKPPFSVFKTGLP